MYTAMIQEGKLEDSRTRTSVKIDLLIERGLDPVHAASYLVMCEGYTREEADFAVAVWLYSDNT